MPWKCSQNSRQCFRNFARRWFFYCWAKAADIFQLSFFSFYFFFFFHCEQNTSGNYPKMRPRKMDRASRFGAGARNRAKGVAGVLLLLFQGLTGEKLILKDSGKQIENKDRKIIPSLSLPLRGWIYFVLPRAIHIYRVPLPSINSFHSINRIEHFFFKSYNP